MTNVRFTRNDAMVVAEYWHILFNDDLQLKRYSFKLIRSLPDTWQKDVVLEQIINHGVTSA